MNLTKSNNLRVLNWFAQAASISVIVLGIIVLIGWQFNIELLYVVIKGLPAMVPNTALGFILSGSSLWLLQRNQVTPIIKYTGQLLATACLLIGILTLIQYTEVAPLLSIDRLLVPFFSQEPFVLRPSPPTAAAFSLAGIALILLGFKQNNLFLFIQWFSLLALMIAVVIFLGYIYGERSFYLYSNTIGMAFHTAIGFFLLAFGILFTNPEQTLIKAAIGNTAGGKVVRNLFPIIILAPPILGWLILYGEKSGIYSEHFGVSLLQVLNLIILVTAIARVAQSLNQEEKLRKQAEFEARQHLAEIAHIDRINSMGEMAANIAHEVQEPVSVISLYAALCKQDLGKLKNQPTELAQFIEVIEIQAKKAIEIIRILQNFGRKHSQEKKSVDLNLIVNETDEFLKIRGHQNNVELNIEASKSPILVYVDSIQIQQALLNIARNCIESVQLVDVKKRKITIQTFVNNNGEAQINISDTGPGINSESLPYIFDPFFSTKGEAGMGMGLSISRSIIEDHNGKLLAESTFGHGATFSIILPVKV